MRVAFWSEEGSSLSWARRLVDEGCEVLLYHAKAHARRIGENLVPLAKTREEWIRWALEKRGETIAFFDCTNHGRVADRLRAHGCLVINGGGFMDMIEMNRAKGEAFAVEHGIHVPPSQRFSNVAQSIHFMQTAKQTVGDGGWAWKPDKDLGSSTTFVGSTEEVTAFCERVIIPQHGNAVACFVQERIPGIALSTARWWNGFEWTGPFQGTIEEKKFMDGDVGPATGCSLNTVWFYPTETPRIGQALHWDALSVGFRKVNAPPGLYDINAIVTKDDAYFLEWTPRLGIDSELTSQRGITTLSGFLAALVTGHDVMPFFKRGTGYHGIRLSIPPYPCDDDQIAFLRVALGVPVENVDSIWGGDFVGVGVRATKDGRIEVADPYGFVGVGVTADRSVKKGFDRILAAVKRFGIPNLQYRTDAAKIVLEDIQKMRATGWPTTPFMED